MTDALQEKTRPASPDGTPTSRARQLAVPLVLIAVCFLIYAPVLYYMGLHWNIDPDYSHGFLIVPLAIYFALERRRELAVAPVAGSWLGLVPLALGIAALAVGRLGAVLTLMRGGFVLTLIGLVLLLLGRRYFSLLAFPLLFLFLMVPLPQTVVNVIAFPLQLTAAQAAVESLHWLHIPALLEGNIIHLADAQLFVDEACSGLRSLMALITLGVVFAYFFRSVMWERALLVASAIPIAIFVNAVRVALTGILTHAYGEEMATGALHEFQGMITFGIAFLLLMFEARLIDLLRPSRWQTQGQPA